MSKKITKQIEGEVMRIRSAESALQSMQDELSHNELFITFIESQKIFREESEQIWQNIESQMIKYDIKQIKGEWGTITLVEKITGWDADLDVLPKKFITKVANNKLLTDTFNLEGLPIKGASPRRTKYLMKRIK